MASFSFTANGTNICSGNCKYCSASETVNYRMGVKRDNIIKSLVEIDEKNYETFKFDLDAVTKAFENDPQIKNRKPGEQLHVDLWGTDPGTNLLMLKDMVGFVKDFAKSHDMVPSLSTSTNGLPLIRDEICDFLEEEDVHIQLSHDGLGQWIRTDEIDPLFDERFAPNLKRLMNNGILNMINCTLNFYNYSPLANKGYWDKYFSSIGMTNETKAKMHLKLNHIYDSDRYDIKAENKDGYFNGANFEALKGKAIGNLNFRNDRNFNSGDPELDFRAAHVLDDYIAEWYHIAILMRDPNVVNDPSWKPYIGYLSEQCRRWKMNNDIDAITGACRAYQRFKHQVGDPKGWKSHTFVIDTTGRYSECNLIDADSQVLNPGGIQAECCQYCPFKHTSECLKCGSEPYNAKCEYGYAWSRFLENVSRLDYMLKVRDDARDISWMQDLKTVYEKRLGKGKQCSCKN